MTATQQERVREILAKSKERLMGLDADVVGYEQRDDSAEITPVAAKAGITVDVRGGRDA